jgi:thiamine biosynthesis lipoprotein
MNELAFPCMGTTVRLVADAPLEPVRAGIEAIAARLTRFDPGSELCALNADPRAEVPASPLLRRAVQAALLGARRTGGLADPTLLDGVEAAGYARSRVGAEPASLEAALRAAPRRRAATPGGRWRAVDVRDHSIVRPPGLRLDLGGSAKGLAADWAASRLDGRYVVDCGGDIRVGGTHDVALRGTAHTLRVTDGAVATSGIDRRVWRRPDGSYAHHLLDPGTGEPAWTGLISATAAAPTALEADALAKAALLAGPLGARRFLCEGIVIRDEEWLAAA